jgi:hypothetical protein
MAANTDYLRRSTAVRVDEPNSNLQRLVDDGTVYVPQALNAPQFATLQALLNCIASADNYAFLAIHLDTGLAKNRAASRRSAIIDYHLGLDELDTLARSRTGFAFVELTPEIQDALLGLISSGDLSTRKLDLALWLQNLRNDAVPSHSLTADNG